MFLLSSGSKVSVELYRRMVEEKDGEKWAEFEAVNVCTGEYTARTMKGKA